jgi:endo-1,4-beta-xylanase
MRKVFIVLTVFALLLILLPGGAEGIDYVSDFTEDFDGWTARSNGGAAISVQEGILAITGRSADWHSPGRDFALIPGTRYEVKGLVYQDEADSAAFMISLAHTAGGRETYENLARGEVRKGEWTELTADFSAGQFGHFVLYVETAGAPRLSFKIRDFSVKTPRASFRADIQSLKILYADYFDFGCAVTRMEAVNPAVMDFYASQFSIMTPGNELKPDSVLDIEASRRLAVNDQNAVAIRLDAVRPLLDYAFEHGIKVHGHVLVWHSQTPEAFFREGYSVTGPFVSRETMLARLDNYIRQIFEKTESLYPGLIVSWDVVNEAVDDATGGMRSSNWTRVVGQDFVREAFRIARKYAPSGVMLYYNDYSTPYEPKLTGILKLLGELKEGGDIDGYGFQCHYQLNTPSIRQLQNAMDKIIALGLTLRMSELDILIEANTEENLILQAKRYGDLLELFRTYKDHIGAVHTWGVTDNLSWKANRFPLLFDGKSQPKPAFFAITDPLI